MSVSPPNPSGLSSSPPCVLASAEADRWFREEVHVHDGQLKAYLRGTFPSVQDVEDVVQESYLRMWEARARRDIRSVKAFLFRMASNLALDGLREKKPESLEALGDFADQRVLETKQGVVEAVDDREKLVLLADAVLALPARCREIVILRKIEGLSQKEVAHRLGKSERTVESQLRIGVARCEKFLRQRGVFASFQ